jgi:hypothetical protein
LECTLAPARILPARTSTHWTEEHWERKSGWRGNSLLLQVDNTFHLMFPDENQFEFISFKWLLLIMAASELFLVPMFTSAVKGFELGIDRRVSVDVQTEPHQVWERRVRIYGLFLWELVISRLFQARIVTLNFSSLLGLAS